jgi:hypothetical protein
MHFGTYMLRTIGDPNRKSGGCIVATRETKALSYSIAATLVLISALFIMGIWWRNIQNSNYEALKQENSSLVEKIGKLLDLPSETPIITTISNKDDFKDKTFFNKIETGDKLLVYLNADQAIFYRPSSNTVTMMLPVSAYLKNYK